MSDKMYQSMLSFRKNIMMHITRLTSQAIYSIEYLPSYRLRVCPKPLTTPHEGEIQWRDTISVRSKCSVKVIPLKNVV